MTALRDWYLFKTDSFATSPKGHYKSEALEQKNSRTARQREQDVSLSLLRYCLKDSPEYCVISVYCVIDQYSVILMDCIAIIDLKHMSEFAACLAQKCILFKKKKKQKRKKKKSMLCFINRNFEHAEKHLEAFF